MLHKVCFCHKYISIYILVCGVIHHFLIWIPVLHRCVDLGENETPSVSKKKNESMQM